MRKGDHLVKFGLLLTASVAVACGVSPRARAGTILYGGQDDTAGAPVVGAPLDPGGALGAGPLSADAARFGATRTYGGVNLGPGLSLEAMQKRPFGDASKPADEAVSLVGKAKVPVTESLSLTGKMGLQYQQSSLFPAGGPNADAVSPSPVYGVGLGYQTASGIELRAESEHVTGRPGDPRTVTGDSFLLGARLRF